jgi:hypothetical protein
MITLESNDFKNFLIICSGKIIGKYWVSWDGDHKGRFLPSFFILTNFLGLLER